MDNQTIQVQVQFTVPATDTLPSYTDAIYYDITSWPVSAPQLQADQQARYDAWAAMMQAPPDPNQEQPVITDPNS